MKRQLRTLSSFVLMFGFFFALGIHGALASISGDAPTVSSSSHTANTSSTKSDIAMSWTKATSSKSTITYEYLLDSTSTYTLGAFSTAHTAAASTHKGTLSNATSMTFSSIADGTYYFHLRAYDVDGIFSGSQVVNFGPIILNSKPTLDSSPISPTSGDHSKAATVTILGSKFMSSATVKLVNGAPASGSTNTATSLSDVSLSNVTWVSANKLTATVPAGTTSGLYDLQVTNGTPNSQQVASVDAYTVSNTAPTAASGDDQTVSLSSGSASFSLSGRGSSDADSDTLSSSSYSWTLATAPTDASVTVSSVPWSTSATKTGTSQSVVVNTAGVYTFTLVVNDGDKNSASDSVTVTVNAAAGSNNKPVVNAGTDQVVIPKATATLTATATDADGDTIQSYTWTLISVPTDSVATIAQSTTGSAKATFTADKTGTYVASVTASDGTVSSDADTITIIANTVPTANAGVDQTAGKGVLTTLDASASTDPEDAASTLGYAWSVSQPEGSSITLSSTTAINPTFTPAILGSYVFTLTVTDSVGKSSTDTMTVTVSNPPDAPNAGPDQTAVLTSNLVTLSGSSADTTTTAFAWTVTSVPAGSGITTASLSDATSIAPTFTPDKGGNYVLSLVVSNSAGVTSSADTVTITANTAPIANAGVDQSSVRAAKITLDGDESSDPDADTLTYSWAFLSTTAAGADGVTLTDVTVTKSSTGLPYATFTPTAIGVYTFTLTVTDTGGLISTDTVDVTVVNQDPALPVSVDFKVPESGSKTISKTLLQATDADAADSLIFTLTTAPTKGTLKNNGVDIAKDGTFTQANIDSGLIVYWPSGVDTETDSFVVSVVDSAGGTPLTDTLNITITPSFGFTGDAIAGVTMVGTGSDTFLFELAGATEATTWVQSVAGVGTLSATGGASATYTASALAMGASAVTDSITVTDTSVTPNRTSTVNITVYSPISTGIISDVGVSSDSSTAIFSVGMPAGGSGDLTCTLNQVGDTLYDATVSGDNGCTIVPSSSSTGSFTVTVTDNASYMGSTTSNLATTSTIEVVAPIQITSSSTVYLDTTTKTTSTVTASGGKTSGSYTFTSSTPTVATVDAATGVVTAVGAGSTTITVADATYSNVTASVNVVVVSPLVVKDSSGNLFTTTQSIVSGGTLNVIVGGGSDGKTVSVSGPESYSATLEGVDGTYTFTAPTTGAFAGIYTLTVSDSNLGDTSTVTISVPLKITLSRTKLLENLADAARVTVTGATSDDVISFQVLDSTGELDANALIATVADVSTVPTADETTGIVTNAAEGIIVTKDISVLTDFAIKATNTTQSEADVSGSYTVVTSDQHSIVPIMTYTLTLMDNTGAVVTSATVKLEESAEILANYGVDVVPSTPPDASGVVTVAGMPTGESYTFTAIPNDSSVYQTGVVELASGTTTGTITLQKIVNARTYMGTIGIDDGGVTDLEILAKDALLNEASGTLTGNSTVCSDTQYATQELCLTNSKIWYQTYSIIVDEDAFTVDKVIVSAKNAKRAVILSSDAAWPLAASCVGAEGETEDACGLANGTWAYDLGSIDLSFIMSATTLKDAIAKPADFSNVTAPEVLPGGVASIAVLKLSSDGTTSATEDFSDKAPAIFLAKDADGNVIGVTVVQQEDRVVVGTAKTTKPATLFTVLEEGETLGGKMEEASDGVKFDTTANADVQIITSVALKVEDAESVFADDSGIDTSTLTPYIDTIVPEVADIHDTAKEGLGIFGNEIADIEVLAFTSKGVSVPLKLGNTVFKDGKGILVTLPIDLAAIKTLAESAGIVDPTEASITAAFEDGTLQFYAPTSVKNVLAGILGEKVTLSEATVQTVDGSTTLTVPMNHFSTQPLPTEADATETSVSGGGGGCFIATAAYGSYEAPYVQLLRQFRDQILLTNTVGSWFVDQYYTYSPPMADWLRQHDGWRAVVRVALLPLIAVSWFLVSASFVTQVALLLATVVLPLMLLGVRRRRVGLSI